MAKNFTLYSSESFISNNPKKLKEIVSGSDSPGETVIQNILNFSKALKIEKSQMVGLVEMILN